MFFSLKPHKAILFIFVDAIDPLLFLVIPRFPKTPILNIATFNLFQANSTITFITCGCHTEIPVSVLLMYTV